MTRYHIDWNNAGYQACAKPDCDEDFHSESKHDCTRQYDQTMLPIYQREGLNTLPPVWTKGRRPEKAKRSRY